MEFNLSFQTAIAATIIYFLILLLYRLLLTPHTNPIKKAPKAAGAWPILGHLHLLARSGPPHILLGNLADKYGPIFTVNIGVHQAFVVSDSKVAKQCFTTNDKYFVNRPKSVAVELMGYNYAMFGLGPYGRYWRHMHRIITHEVLSNKQVKLHSKILVSEVKETIKDIYKGCCLLDSKKMKIEMKYWFGSLSLNMVVRMIAGKRYDSDDDEGLRSKKALRKFFKLMGAFEVSDAIPFLRWFDLEGYVEEMKKTGREIDYILTGWLEEHKRNKYDNREHNTMLSEVEERDFMDVMSDILEGSSHEDLAGFDVDTVNKATCLTILTGSTDTTTVTLTWALSLLLNNRHVLEAAQHELDIYVGRNRQVEESDTKNLAYLQAIVKETMRLYPAGPLSSPREAIEDCILGGYNIPKGSRLIVNLSKIHRDPEVWSDPNEFRPERFFTQHKDVDIRGHHFELLPFGGGRRICPGISLGMQIVVLTLASLIHGFDISTPLDESIDMSESSGLTNLKATPLEVFLTPRLYSYG